MKSRPILAGIGELLWDFLPSGKQLGGAPCNFVFHAMQAGCDGYIVSAIGKDELGIELKHNLRELGLSNQYVQENKFPTSTVTIKLDENGHPDFAIHKNIAWDHIYWNHGMEKLAKEVDAVCFGSLAQRNPESEHSIVSFIKATRPECLRVFDINLRQNYYSKEIIISALNLSDILKLNEDELAVVSGYLGFKGDFDKQLDQIFSYFNLKYIVYTLGSKGSIIISAKESSFAEVPKVQVADTVGAGDSFTAIFITGILKGIPLKKIHKKATEISAYVCTQKGATPKLTQKIF
ncbi:MAG: carbohydrate kinase [Bacteroidales bacterium]